MTDDERECLEAAMGLRPLCDVYPCAHDEDEVPARWERRVRSGGVEHACDDCRATSVEQRHAAERSWRPLPPAVPRSPPP